MSSTGGVMQQRGNWSYMQASQELDRIIRNSDPSYSASTPCTTHSYSSNNHTFNTASITPDVSCSICGHATAHFPIRSSSDVLLGASSSAIRTPQPVPQTHSHGSHAQTHTPYSSNTSSYNASSSNTRDSSVFSASMLKQSTTSNHSHITTSANASRQLRHRLTPHSVAYTTTPLLHTSTVGSASGTGHNSMLRTPESLVHIEAQGAANSVVSAFRELQAKTKMIESERTSAYVVRDELRQELAEVRRKHGLSRNKDEARNNKHLQSIKVSTEEQLVSCNYTRSVYQQQQEIAQSQNHQVETLTNTQTQLTGDIEQLNSKIAAAEHRLRALRETLITSRDQSNSLEKVLGSQSIREKSDVQKEIDTLIAAIKEEKNASARSHIRSEGLTKYMEIILKVNGDLVRALSTRQSLDDKITDIARKQMKKLLQNREKEVNRILNNAREVGVQKALQVSRNVHLLSDMYLNQTATRHQSSLVETAARMAATSAHNAVVAANLAGTSSASCTACYRPKFIPSSSNKNQEFNVVASVSKAAREAKSLNARLASKVKSLDCEGVGALYKDVYRVDLQDMHDQLRAVKRMLHSATP